MYEYLGITIHEQDPPFANNFSKKLLEDYYLRNEETIPQAFARASVAFCNQDLQLAQRIYDAAYNGWFMFASPVLSNAPLPDENIRAMPISCFATTMPDTINGQMDTVTEVSSLSVAGGGVGLHNEIRATSEKAPGPIPYMKMMDSVVGYYKQARTRRAATAVYMDIDHPDIVEHIKFRIPSQGDPARKSDNLSQFHNAVNITDDFVDAVVNDKGWQLICPHSGEVRETISARELWEIILETRALTGEPYIFHKDNANRALPQSQKDLGLEVKGANLCNEITLPTNDLRTFVCCLSSLNLETYYEWKDQGLVADAIRFLDNVLQYFIDNAQGMEKAVYAAQRERALGLGTMGYHLFLQKNNIPLESGGLDSAVQITNTVYKDIREQALEESKQLAKERGEPEDMKGTGYRNSHLIAIAPNSNNAIIAQTSPSIEPMNSNAYTHSTRAGSFLVKNKILEQTLEDKGYNTDAVWQDIIQDQGSVQHLDILTDHEKSLFKTAFEIDQHWIVELGEHRAKYICQSQSLNLFFPPGASREYVNSVHLKAIRSPYLKGLYYFRTGKESQADTAKDIERKALQDWNGEECIACSG